MRSYGRDAAIAGAVFMCTALAFWWLIGQRLIYTLDEGIWFDGACRILGGQVIYRDFFAYLGPGAFWNSVVMFQTFGVTLGASHLILVADLALIAACLYWLAAQLGSRAAGLWLSATYLAEMAFFPGMLTVNHRWDSAALSAAAGVALFFGASSGARWALVVAGALSGYAAWTTPSMLLVLLPMLGWAAYERRWVGAGLFVAGVTAVSVAAAGVLAAQGALVPMVRHMLWASANYSGPNSFMYGGKIGGWGSLIVDPHDMPSVAAGLLVIALMGLPALVPLGAAAGLVLSKRMRTARMWWLAACAAGSLAAVAPRMDVRHLVYSAAFSYVIAMCALMCLPRRARTAILVALSLCATIMACIAVTQRLGLERIQSRVGILRGSHNDVSLAQGLERAVAPGESFFAFPYSPLAYFLTQGTNPTRYSYLQPGMMTDQDEEAALASLRLSPPRKALYADLDVETLLQIWPTTDPNRLQFKKIERWLRENYTPVEQFSREHPGYRLLVRKDAGGR
jgi:hypothetical protein